MANNAQTSHEEYDEREEHNEEPTEELVQVEPAIIPKEEVTENPHALLNPGFQNPSNSSVKFTFDDVPLHKWKTRFQKMQAWCFAELQRPNMTHAAVIKSFLARLTSFIKVWFDSLGQYHQLQYLNTPTVEGFIGALYWKFCRKQDHLWDITKEEFFKLTCCSNNPKDLDKHFQNAVRCFYLIRGMDDLNIRQAYLESIPQHLGQEALRVIEMKGQSLGTTSFGELHNMVQGTLKKLCNQQTFLTDIQTTCIKLEKACEHPELKIKCLHDNKSCSCPRKKKHHFKKFKFRKKYPKPFPNKRRFFRCKFSRKKEIVGSFADKRNTLKRTAQNKKGESASADLCYHSY
ncbi:putative zinc finger protein [Abeliophyllum distichum]|uniref:Zinc finger protein n=1 Tax=Abeliophyllum distichum TaxID=126358 RepID=A0ABD1TKS4_9LAMI